MIKEPSFFLKLIKKHKKELRRDLIYFSIFMFLFTIILIVSYNVEQKNTNCILFSYENEDIYFGKIMPEKAFQEKLIYLANQNWTIFNSSMIIQSFKCRELEEQYNVTIEGKGLLVRWGDE